jgi:hypothetical protein
VAADARRRLARRLGRARARRLARHQPLGRLPARRPLVRRPLDRRPRRTGDIVWDAYLAFGKTSRWRSEPSGVVAAGSDIIDNTSGLEQHFIPLLTRG